MTNEQIYLLWEKVSEYNDPDAFASNAPSILGPDNLGQEMNAEQLRILWHVANDPFRDFLILLGLTQAQCSRRFCIPLRTIQHWAGNERRLRPYDRLMMAELMGIISVD